MALVVVILNLFDIRLLLNKTTTLKKFKYNL